MQMTIPNGWKKIKVNKAFEFIPTTSHSKGEMTYEEENSSSIYNIHYGDIHAKYKIFVDFEKDKTPHLRQAGNGFDRNLLKSGDLVMVDASEDLEGVGTCIEIKNLDNKKCVAGLHTFALRDLKKCTTHGYRGLMLKHKAVKLRMQQVSTYSKVFGISKKSFSDIDLFLPPLPEQEKIVEVLEIWDSYLYELAQTIKHKKKRKNGLMQKLLTGKCRVLGFSSPWSMMYMGDLFIERKESKYNNLPLLSITANQGVIHQSSSNKKNTSNNDKSKYKRICPGDIGYNTMRMWQGRCALSQIEGIVSPAYTIVTPKKNANSFYFAYLFKTPRLAYLFLQKSQGLVSDTWNCKFKDFAKVKYQVPDYEEQTAIAQILVAADQEIEALEKKRELIEVQKKFLLNNLVTGKIRLPEFVI